MLVQALCVFRMLVPEEIVLTTLCVGEGGKMSPWSKDSRSFQDEVLLQIVDFRRAGTCLEVLGACTRLGTGRRCGDSSRLLLEGPILV